MLILYPYSHETASINCSIEETSNGSYCKLAKSVFTRRTFLLFVTGRLLIYLKRFSDEYYLALHHISITDCFVPVRVFGCTSPVERGSSVVECWTRNQVSSGSNPSLLPFRRLSILVLSIEAPVHSAV